MHGLTQLEGLYIQRTKLL